MKLIICAIYDKNSKSYQQPFVAPNKATAIRNFMQACKEEKSFLYEYPQDFRLEHVANFYVETGAMDSVQDGRILCEAENVVVKNEQKA